VSALELLFLRRLKCERDAYFEWNDCSAAFGDDLAVSFWARFRICLSPFFFQLLTNQIVAAGKPSLPIHTVGSSSFNLCLT
jgi:hypothetical protein